MNISFKKKQGNPSLGIEFFWLMTLESKAPDGVEELFIPELFYDYFFIKRGNIKSITAQYQEIALSPQTLKTIHTHPLRLVFSTPLILYGARLSLKFAETFWGETIQSNSFIEQTWVDQNTKDLASFASQVTKTIQKHRESKTIAPLLSATLEESAWLDSYSARHKSRLYRSVFGVSKKELWSIRNIHSFLEQTCDFTSKTPRIIRHVNPEVFHDQPHLNHAFKKASGLSPTEYFEANSILQNNLMSVSYNEISNSRHKI